MEKGVPKHILPGQWWFKFSDDFFHPMGSQSVNNRQTKGRVPEEVTGGSWWNPLYMLRCQLLNFGHRFFHPSTPTLGKKTYPPGNDHISPKKWHFESMIFRTSRLVEYVSIPWRVTLQIGKGPLWVNSTKKR